MSASDILSRTTIYWPALQMLVASCENCGDRIEFVTSSGKLTYGYVYAAGSPHFEGVADVDAPGLTRSYGEDSITIRLGEEKYLFEAKEDERQWFAVMQGMHAVGRTISELELESLGARIERAERAHEPLGLTPQLQLGTSDRLLLTGRHSALTRVWERLRTGK